MNDNKPSIQARAAGGAASAKSTIASNSSTMVNRRVKKRPKPNAGTFWAVATKRAEAEKPMIAQRNKGLRPIRSAKKVKKTAGIAPNLAKVPISTTSCADRSNAL